MFKKINRISSWLFKPLLKGKTYFSPCFRVKYINTDSNFKISVVIPKKIIKKRVTRNTLKRKILHHIKENMVTDKKFNCVFWVSKNINTSSNESWRNEINQLLKTMGIKKTDS